MASIEVRIPQLGEGLQEARLIRFLKQPGDSVAQDEPIFEMETDKAVMEIESPAAGVLQSWSAKEDDVLPIGAVIGRIETDGAMATPVDVVQEPDDKRQTADQAAQASTHPELEGQASDVLRAGRVAPRTRAYARELGIGEDVLASLSQASSHRLLPEDLDRYLAKQADARAAPVRHAGPEFKDLPLPQHQRTLVYRMSRGAREVIPATMEMRLDWGPIESMRERLRKAGGAIQPSQFLLFAWCVARAAVNHSRFRSALKDESTIREYENLHLGIAVARPDDELLLARVPAADSLSLVEFVTRAQEAIKRAREGEDQAADVMQISLTNMAGSGVRWGIPVLVAPAVATLFVGEAFHEACPLPAGGIGFRRSATMVLTFDHRIANGVGAADFLNTIRKNVSNLPDQPT